MGGLDRIFRRRAAFQQRPLAAIVAGLWQNNEQGVEYDIPGFRDAWNNVGPELLVGEWTFSPGIGGTVAAMDFASATNGAAAMPISASSGKAYKVTFEITSYTSGSPQVIIGQGVGIPIPTPASLGIRELIVTAGPVDGVFRIYAGVVGAGGTYSIKNLSVREWVGRATCALYQDAAGVVPAYMPGRGQAEPPVGLLLDKRFGLQTGPELLVNGSFEQGSESWTVAGTDATHIATFSGGQLRYQSDTTTPVLLVSQPGVMVVGRWYLVEIDVASRVSGSLYIPGLIGVGAGSTVFFAAGKTRIIALATSTTLGIGRNATPVDITINGISVKELKGNHAYQATTTSRAVLSARYNLLTNTAFSGAVVGSPGTAPTGWSSNFNTASITSVTQIGDGYAIQITAVGQRLFFAQAFSAASATTYSVSCLVVENSGLPLEQILGFTAMPSGATLQWYLDGVANVGTAIPAAGSRAEVRLVVGATSGTPAARIGIGAAVNATGVVTVAKPDVRVANDGIGLPPYQRVIDPLFYDTVGFPLYLASDGVDDWMMTSSIDFSGVSRVIVVAAARKLNDTLANTLLELSPAVNSNPGSFALFGPISAASPGWALRYAGATPFQDINVLSAGFVSAVLSARIALDGAGASLSANGVTASNASVSGGGSLGNYSLYLFRRAGSTLPFKGRFYGLTIRGGVTLDSQLSAVGKLLNQKAKVY